MSHMTRVFAVDSLARSCAVSTPNAETCFLRSTTDHSKTALLAHAVAAINIITGAHSAFTATLTRLHRRQIILFAVNAECRVVSCVSTTTARLHRSSNIILQSTPNADLPLAQLLQTRKASLLPLFPLEPGAAGDNTASS
jgi:hypothetical protein